MSDGGRARSVTVTSRARWDSVVRDARARRSLLDDEDRGTAERKTVLAGATSQRGRPISVSVTATPPPRRAVTWFDRWVAQSMPVGAAALNIGAGANRSGDLQRVRGRAGTVVGVDPSDRIHDNKHLDERYQESLEQFAPGHPDEFDVAFSVFVVEHVADPDGFARAAAAVLKPGGTLMSLTVNKWHYFGLTTWAATRLGVCEWLLTRVRDDVGYHYPTEYRWNTVGAISRVLSRAGFSSVEFRMWDLPTLYTPYLPTPVVEVASLWNRAVYRLDQPRLMGNLTFKAIL